MNMASSTVFESPHPRVRVLVADDHEVMRLGIRNLLEVHPGWSICAEANNGQEAVEKTLQFHPGRDHHGHHYAGDERPRSGQPNYQETAGNPRHSVLAAPVRRFVSPLQDRWDSRSGGQGRCGARPGAGGRDSFGRRNILPWPKNHFELTQDFGWRAYRRGRRWPVMGSYQRLPFAPSRWGTLSSTSVKQSPLSGICCRPTRKIAYNILLVSRTIRWNSPH